MGMNAMAIRRLPVYFVIETSAAMQDKSEAVMHSIRSALNYLRAEPFAIESVWLSVITFDEEARQLCPLTELPLFSETPLQYHGCAHLQFGLRLLRDCLDREVIRGRLDLRGDWKPTVLLYCRFDSDPETIGAVRLLMDRRDFRLIVCLLDGDASASPVAGLADLVISLRDMELCILRDIFSWRWVSASIRTTSTPADPVIAPLPVDDIQW